jgi:hypothetical protein
VNETLLHDVLTLLARRGTPAALIGAIALAAHGIARATLDLDLLALDTGLLSAEPWRDLSKGGDTVEVRRGDAEDPLAGVIRLTRSGQTPVDVVVGRHRWMEGVLTRAGVLSFGERQVPIVDAADLVLLKVFAGGPQDLLDAELLLAGEKGEELRSEVEARLPVVPSRLRQAVRRLLARRRS